MRSTPARDCAPRLALRPKEAAKALGISERTLRQMLPELPHIRLGGSILIPVNCLREWLREGSEREAGRAKETAEEILGAMGKASDD